MNLATFGYIYSSVAAAYSGLNTLDYAIHGSFDTAMMFGLISLLFISDIYKWRRISQLREDVEQLSHRIPIPVMINSEYQPSYTSMP